ncbi:glycosyltransferase [Mesorhizobium sp. M0968]|uniref:glycosyltransferase n=1 Tax=Mesorhizobium sp. M0968 TaxID=2957037 RepID=UPI00333679B7
MGGRFIFILDSVIQRTRTEVKVLPLYPLVLPIYNEEQVLPRLVERISSLMCRLDGEAEAIFVDDGSDDGSVEYLSHAVAADPRFRLIELSRNFGLQIAITAGIDAAAGGAVIVMDADLQDPLEVVLDLVAKWKEGFEIAYARRVNPGGKSWFKRFTRPGGVACIIEHNPYNLLTRLAVFRCPFDQDAVLLNAAKARCLFQHFLLLPLARPFARKIERALAPLPLGAQYACSTHP